MLKKPFDIEVEFKKLAYSEILNKFDKKELDMSPIINLTFQPIQLVLPQSIYTFMLRMVDLNMGYTDEKQ